MQAFIMFTLFALFVRLSALITGDVPELSDEVFPITEDEVDDLFDRLLNGTNDADETDNDEGGDDE